MSKHPYHERRARQIETLAAELTRERNDAIAALHRATAHILLLEAEGAELRGTLRLARLSADKCAQVDTGIRLTGEAYVTSGHEGSPPSVLSGGADDDRNP